MTQKTRKMTLLGLPILAAIIVGSVGLSDAFAEDKLDSLKFSAGDELLIKGQTEGWAIFNGEAHPANISFEGKAILDEDGLWQLVTTSTVDYGSGTANVFLKGNAHDGKIRLTGTGTSEDGINLNLILRGHYAPISEQPGQFALDWTFSKIQVPENGIKISMFQDGIISIMHN